ncbi:hypothetical protein NEOLEDRAFT_1150426 [Neolentinus lepideus HHB14362 ss-1]|uniref:Uncharacterized protein n=1 Tax=Neolentinus lepideus HHB14362 ss-1 TaxID=1314782 RepID=A0A165Q2N9_9AGAM|nr:hypothetical protein NEOLEDRAFT_1150426 [Neolentinus lepideus HHB14362 ss-1]
MPLPSSGLVRLRELLARRVIERCCHFNTSKHSLLDSNDPAAYSALQRSGNVARERTKKILHAELEGMRRYILGKHRAIKDYMGWPKRGHRGRSYKWQWKWTSDSESSIGFWNSGTDSVLEMDALIAFFNEAATHRIQCIDGRAWTVGASPAGIVPCSHGAHYPDVKSYSKGLAPVQMTVHMAGAPALGWAGSEEVYGLWFHHDSELRTTWLLFGLWVLQARLEIGRLKPLSSKYRII